MGTTIEGRASWRSRERSGSSSASRSPCSGRSSRASTPTPARSRPTAGAGRGGPCPPRKPCRSRLQRDAVAAGRPSRDPDRDRLAPPEAERHLSRAEARHADTTDRRDRTAADVPDQPGAGRRQRLRRAGRRLRRPWRPYSEGTTSRGQRSADDRERCNTHRDLLPSPKRIARYSRRVEGRLGPTGSQRLPRRLRQHRLAHAQKSPPSGAGHTAADSRPPARAWRNPRKSPRVRALTAGAKRPSSSNSSRARPAPGREWRSEE